MFDVNHYTHDQSYVPQINRPHAPEQWRTRTPAGLTLVEAWKQAVPIRAPDCDADSTRLYAPYDALLVERSGVLRTVLNNDGRVETDGLSTCPSCNGLYDPLRTEGSCRWCGAPLPSQRTTASVTLVRGGEQ
jgi:hypothetical protein